MTRRPSLLRALFSCGHNLAADARGAAALEYGILASIIAIILINIFSRLGSSLSVLFSKVDVSI